MSINKFYPINIQDSNIINGTYSDVSLLVNGNEETKGTSVLKQVAINKSIDASYNYDLDINGQVIFRTPNLNLNNMIIVNGSQQINTLVNPTYSFTFPLKQYYNFTTSNPCDITLPALSGINADEIGQITISKAISSSELTFNVTSPDSIRVENDNTNLSSYVMTGNNNFIIIQYNTTSLNGLGGYVWRIQFSAKSLSDVLQIGNIASTNIDMSGNSISNINNLDISGNATFNNSIITYNSNPLQSGNTIVQRFSNNATGSPYIIESDSIFDDGYGDTGAVKTWNLNSSISGATNILTLDAYYNTVSISGTANLPNIYSTGQIVSTGQFVQNGSSGQNIFLDTNISSSALTPLKVTSSDSGSSTATLSLFRKSTTPAINDGLFNLSFEGAITSGGVIPYQYSKIYSTLIDPTPATRTGKLTLSTTINAVSTDMLILDASGVSILTDLSCNNINLVNINGSPYTGGGGSSSLSSVLAVGNSAGIYDIDMSGQNITGIASLQNTSGPLPILSSAAINVTATNLYLGATPITLTTGYISQGNNTTANEIGVTNFNGLVDFTAGVTNPIVDYNYTANNQSFRWTDTRTASSIAGCTINLNANFFTTNFYLPDPTLCPNASIYVFSILNNGKRTIYSDGYVAGVKGRIMGTYGNSAGLNNVYAIKGASINLLSNGNDWLINLSPFLKYTMTFTNTTAQTFAASVNWQKLRFTGGSGSLAGTFMANIIDRYGIQPTESGSGAINYTNPDRFVNFSQGVFTYLGCSAIIITAPTGTPQSFQARFSFNGTLVPTIGATGVTGVTSGNDNGIRSLSIDGNNFTSGFVELQILTAYTLTINYVEMCWNRSG